MEIVMQKQKWLRTGGRPSFVNHHVYRLDKRVAGRKTYSRLGRGLGSLQILANIYCNIVDIAHTNLLLIQYMYVQYIDIYIYIDIDIRYSFIYLFIHLFMYSFIYLFIYFLFIYLLLVICHRRKYGITNYIE